MAAINVLRAVGVKVEPGGDMHLSPAALDSAIRLLDHAPAVRVFGDMLETADQSGENRMDRTT
jgi:hypothetical protein